MSEGIINTVEHKDDPNHHHHPHIHHKHGGYKLGQNADTTRADLQRETKSADSVAKDAMLNEGKVSDEVWEGSPEQEKDNYVQEELYIHDKVLIVDDKFAVCGSANMNDRVRWMSLPAKEEKKKSFLILTSESLVATGGP